MVFFTCCSCGDALKKNAVEKHFSSRCSSAQYVTCIDCSKDFWGDDYNNHTSCMTEDEKYGSSGQVAKELKGKKKQQQWIQNLKLYLENYKDLDSKLQSVIQKIIAYDNIPQKEKKFKNFLGNSLRLNPKVIDKAWEIFQGALKNSPKTSNDSNNGVIHLEKDSSNDTVEIIADDVTNDGDNLLDKCLKKKKGKKRKIDDEENNADNALNGHSPTKKQKNKCEQATEMEVGLQTDVQMTDETLKKKKKKSCNNKRELTNEIDDSSVSKTNIGDLSSSKESKKEKIFTIDLDQNMEYETSKKIKKSKKRSVSEMEEVTEEKFISTNGDLRRTKKKLKLESIESNDCIKEFRWEDSVKLALESNAGALKIKKLEKIVVPQLLETKLVLSEVEAKRLFKEHISSPMYVMHGKIIQLK